MCNSRRYAVLVLVLVNVLGAVAGVWAEPIDDFLAFNERFYYLDRQSVGTITARLECPTLINSMKTLREQLAHMQKAVSITGEPASYTLTYHPQHGLKLNPPELKVEQIASEGVKNQETFARGLEQVRSGIQQQLGGIVQTMTSVFQGFREFSRTGCRVAAGASRPRSDAQRLGLGHRWRVQISRRR